MFRAEFVNYQGTGPMFRKHLLEAAEAAVADGTISRSDMIRLRFATLMPRVCDRLEQAAAEQLAHDKGCSVASMGAIDWASLLAFIKEIMPIILQLIALFS